MSYDESLVPVKVWLPASVYRCWERTAREHGKEVGQLLAEKAGQSVKRPSRTPEKPRRTWVRFTDERLQYARQLASLGYSQREIAITIGVSPSTIGNHWHRITKEEAA